MDDDLAPSMHVPNMPGELRRPRTHVESFNGIDTFLESLTAKKGPIIEFRLERPSLSGDGLRPRWEDFRAYGDTEEVMSVEVDGTEVDEEGEKYEDVTKKHKELIKYFEENPLAMENPYSRLEQDKWVLKVDDDQNSFLYRVVNKMKNLKSDKDENRKKQWKENVHKIIHWLVIHKPDLLDPREENNDLENASKYHVQVAYCILNLLLDRKTQEMLRLDCNGVECPINRDLPLIAFFMESMPPGDMQCPHKHKKEIQEIHEKLKPKLEKAAQKHQLNMPCLHRIMMNYRASPDRNAVEQLVRLSGAKVILRPGDDATDQLLHLIVKQFQMPKEQDRQALEDLRDIIKTIVGICPQALYKKDKNKTAYEELLQYNRNEGGRANTKANAINLRMEVLEVLKEAYIGDPMKSHSEKIGYLYPTGEIEKNICLDLGADTAIGENYVKAITKQKFDTFKFETYLSYVSLPPRKHARMLKGKLEKVDFLDSYEVIFDFLKKEGVKKIFKIIVNDLIGSPHSDKMIIELTKSFNIEHWAWKKLDISSDVIFNAAQNVKTIELHSSGSFAALQGWACKHGLIKLPNLEAVHVVIHQGVEDKETLIEYKNSFEEELKRRFEKKKKNVVVDVNIKDAVPSGTDYSDDTGHDELGGRTKKNHHWLDHMKNFTEGMRNYGGTGQIPSVKVALIDDGIIPEKTTFRVYKGGTFDEMGGNGVGDYFVDAGPHGTVMGRLITMMCPNVHLYVARIKRGSSSDIPATAVKEAVKWALDRGVDIISMSWTIPANGPNQTETKEFAEMIGAAVMKNKLLFCALRETEDALIAKDFYPVGLDQVFKIGSATRAGNLVKTNSGDENIAQFILPGLEVLLEHETGVNTLHGSSVATALASGLAALILACADLVDQDAANSDNPRTFGPSLRNIANMRSVFENMGRKSNDKKFLEVQKYFKFAGKDPTIDDIKHLITSLTSGEL